MKKTSANDRAGWGKKQIQTGRNQKEGELNDVLHHFAVGVFGDGTQAF